MCAIPVLVTSVGGNVGQGIVKALRNATQKFRIVGVDMEPRSAGFSFVDAYYTVMRSGEMGFFERLSEIHEREKYEAIYVCSHAELDAFGRHKLQLEHQLGVTIFVNPPHVLAIGRDKLKTADFLRDHGMAYPLTARADDQPGIGRLLATHGFPVVVKPRIGASSMNVFIAQSMDEIDAARRLFPDMIVQQYIPDANSEYTAGTVSDAQGRVRASIILHRDLLQGTTYRTELFQDERVTRRIIRIVEALKAVGPCNVQFRLHNDEVYPFEINPRFSGTSGLRYLYGFNDPELIFELLHRRKTVTQPVTKPGVVLRYWDEVYVPDASFSDLREAKTPWRGRQIVLTPGEFEKA